MNPFEICDNITALASAAVVSNFSTKVLEGRRAVGRGRPIEVWGTFVAWGNFVTWTSNFIYRDFPLTRIMEVKNTRVTPIMRDDVPTMQESR